MRLLLFFILTVSAIPQASASVEAPYPHRTYSENGLYYIRTIPFYLGNDTGKTEAFRTDSTLLYRIDKYQHDAFLSNDGRYIVTYTGRVFKENPITTPLITILKDGKPFREISAQQLVDTSKVNGGVGFSDFRGSAVWAKRVFMHNDTLYALTTEKKAAIIDIHSGTIVSFDPDSAVLKRFRASMPLQKTEYVNIKIPDSYQIPTLSDKRSFLESISKEFKIKAKENCKNCRKPVMIEIVIAQDGTAKLHSFSGDENAPPGTREKLAKWISNHSFDNSQIPKETELWKFDDYFFFEDYFYIYDDKR